MKERGRGRPALNKVPKPAMVLLRPESNGQDGVSLPENSDVQLLRKSVSATGSKLKI